MNGISFKPFIPPPMTKKQQKLFDQAIENEYYKANPQKRIRKAISATRNKAACIKAATIKI